MRVLIVESQPTLGTLWKDHLERHQMSVDLVTSQSEAIRYLQIQAPDIIILNLVIEDGSALAVADYASYRLPDVRVIFVTNTTFFSDGSIFSHAHNACAFLPSGTPPEDIVAMVEHYGNA